MSPLLFMVGFAVFAITLTFAVLMFDRGDAADRFDREDD